MVCRLSVALAVVVSMSGGVAIAADDARPELEVHSSASAADTLSAIKRHCVDEGEPVAARDERSVTCELPMGRPERIAARVLLHDLFAPAPRAFVRFSVVQTPPDGSTIQVSGWVADSRPNVRMARLAGPRFKAPMLTFLTNLNVPPRLAPSETMQSLVR